MSQLKVKDSIMLTDTMKTKISSVIDLHANGLCRLKAMWEDERALFYDDKIGHSLDQLRRQGAVFLGGPTSRDAIPDYLWRKDAHHYLRTAGFDGFIIAPEFRGQSYLLNTFKDDFTSSDFVHKWERVGLRHSKYRVFWVPRNREQLLGLTTNRELGQWMAIAENDKRVSERLFIGWSDNAISMGSVEYEIGTSHVGHALLNGANHYTSLEELCNNVANMQRQDIVPRF